MVKSFEKEKPINVIFVCRGNRFRSQLAVAFAVEEVKRRSLATSFDFSSAGLKPSLRFIDIFKNQAAGLLKSELMKSVESIDLANDRTTKVLNTFGIDWTLSTPRQLTAELLVSNDYVFCFTGRQLGKIQRKAKDADVVSREGIKPKIHLLTNYTRLGGDIPDPDEFIAVDGLSRVLNTKTVMNCWRAGEYKLARRAMIDIFLIKSNLPDRLSLYQAQKIRRCVALAIDRMIDESVVPAVQEKNLA